MGGLTRRNVLRGIGGVALPIPFLSSLSARAAAAPEPHPLVVIRQGNGVAQSTSGMGNPEPDYFWPREVGPLTPALLGAQTSQGTSVLARWASKLLLVKGTDAVFSAPAERHAAGGNQLLTAMPPGPPTHSIMTYAQGESVDNLVARMQPEVNGGEPLTLYTGPRGGMGEEILSYRAAEDLRAAEEDPWSVYRRLLGGTGTPDQRHSVNDFVLDQLRALAGSTQLSTEDRDRLERHTTSIRDFEVLCARLSAEQEEQAMGLSGLGTLDEHRITMARLHCDILALCLECDLVRAATLQIGDRIDLTGYEVGGVRQRQFHSISHREQGEGDLTIHRGIDRLIMGEVYSYLLERLSERGILDRSIVVYVSELGNGVTHSFENLPWVIAGMGDGTLRTGVYGIAPRWEYAGKACGTPHNKVLNTLITATGIRATDGGPYTTFGDPSLPPGLLDFMVSPSAPI